MKTVGSLKDEFTFTQATSISINGQSYDFKTDVFYDGKDFKPIVKYADVPYFFEKPEDQNRWEKVNQAPDIFLQVGTNFDGKAKDWVVDS